MITLHRLNGVEFVVNADLIKFIESTPDTLITIGSSTKSDEKFMVKEKIEEVMKMTIEYKQKCFHWPKEV